MNDRIARQVAAQNHKRHARKIASLKQRIVDEIRAAGRECPLSNHMLFSRINDGLDHKVDRLRIVPVANISSATGALKRKGVLVDVGVGVNEKNNPETLMSLGEWAAVPPDVKTLNEAHRLRAAMTRKIVRLVPAQQVAILDRFLRYLERKRTAK